MGTLGGMVECGDSGCGVTEWGCWVWSHRCGDMDVGPLSGVTEWDIGCGDMDVRMLVWGP